MRDDQDAFGHLLFDCLHGEQVVEIVERDDGFIDAARASAHSRAVPEV